MAGYDMIPWKLVFCERDSRECSEECLYINDLPRAPEPGRIPAGCTHVHVRPKLSADQRDARGDHQWRSLLMGAMRCPHGRIQGDACRGPSCLPYGWAPLQIGKLIGYTHLAQPIRVPPREDRLEIGSWYER